MIKWEGFIKESKKYMEYGKKTSKLNFWRRVPWDWVKYHWYSVVIIRIGD